MVVEKNDPESRVQFVSDAPLEKITGVGHALIGDVELDPSAVSATKGKLELEVASIRTNIDLRDEHLRGPGWLDAAKYPKIKFEIKKVSGAETLVPNQSVELSVLGKLSMHGVTRDEPATATVRWIPGEGVRVQAQFKVNLTNYKISVPALVRLKVSDEIALNVLLRVKTRN
jgi:polyisoprenoid-binding protein YceI